MATSKNQGEGDYESARRYDEDTRRFIDSGKVDKAAHDAEPTTKEEADELVDAEEAGKSRARGEDPALYDSDKGKKDASR